MKFANKTKQQLIDMFELQLMREAGDAWIKNEEQPEIERSVIYQEKQYYFHTIGSDRREIVLAEVANIQTEEEWNKSFGVYQDDPQYEGLLIQLIQTNQDKKEKSV